MELNRVDQEPEATPVPLTIPSANMAALEALAALPAETEIRCFGDYQLLSEIARGGMGVVYKARQTKLNRIVALKMILSGVVASAEDIQRFRIEAEAAANLDHPGIVPIHEIGQHEGQHFFSMSFVDGCSLADHVNSGPLPPQKAAELTHKIADAIAYAHSHNIIHRDLKPANVLLDQNGEPRITDFGLARKTNTDSGITKTGAVMGTPSYMPPEQAAGRMSDVGPLSDVYSLGAILYCLLTGRPPFQAANPLDTLQQVLEEEPVSVTTLNSNVPTDLSTICGKCLQKDPAKRYRSAKDLADDLGRWERGDSILARPTGYLERMEKWSKKQPAAAVSIGLIPVIVLRSTETGVSAGAIIAGMMLSNNSRGSVVWMAGLLSLMGSLGFELLTTPEHASLSGATPLLIAMLACLATIGLQSLWYSADASFIYRRPAMIVFMLIWFLAMIGHTACANVDILFGNIEVTESTRFVTSSLMGQLHRPLTIMTVTASGLGLGIVLRASTVPILTRIQGDSEADLFTAVCGIIASIVIADFWITYLLSSYYWYFNEGASFAAAYTSISARFLPAGIMLLLLAQVVFVPFGILLGGVIRRRLD